MFRSSLRSLGSLGSPRSLRSLGSPSLRSLGSPSLGSPSLSSLTSAQAFSRPEAYRAPTPPPPPPPPPDPDAEARATGRITRILSILTALTAAALAAPSHLAAAHVHSPSHSPVEATILSRGSVWNGRDMGVSPAVDETDGETNGVRSLLRSLFRRDLVVHYLVLSVPGEDYPVLHVLPPSDDVNAMVEVLHDGVDVSPYPLSSRFLLHAAQGREERGSATPLASVDAWIRPSGAHLVADLNAKYAGPDSRRPVEFYALIGLAVVSYIASFARRKPSSPSSYAPFVLFPGLALWTSVVTGRSLVLLDPYAHAQLSDIKSQLHPPPPTI